MKTQAPPFDLVIGLDRSDRKVDVHLLDLSSGQEQSATVATDPNALQVWATELRQRFPKHRVALLFEQPANNLIAFFSRFDWITLYPINPISLQKFRESFVVSRAKDDSLDAKFMAHLLAHHWSQFRPWTPEDAPTRQLQRLVVDRRNVVDHRTGLGNRLQALLKDYFPQALDLIGEEVFRPLGHHAAVRALAYKWIRVVWRCWQDRTLYQEDHYLAALRKAGSPLIAWMEKNPSTPRISKIQRQKSKDSKPSHGDHLPSLPAKENAS
jgi:hypothetical protein